MKGQKPPAVRTPAFADPHPPLCNRVAVLVNHKGQEVKEPCACRFWPEWLERNREAEQWGEVEGAQDAYGGNITKDTCCLYFRPGKKPWWYNGKVSKIYVVKEKSGDYITVFQLN